TNTWATMAAMPAALDSIDGIVIKDKIYIPGGDTNGGDTYVYDIATDSWSTIAANGGYSGRAQYQVVAIGDNLYVLGGIAGAASTTEVWVLDTTTGTWTAGTPMQRTRTSFSAAAIDGQIYVAGGVAFPGFAPDMTAEKFDGSAWSFIASLPNGGGAYTRWSYNADGHGADGLWLAAGRRDAGWAVLNHAGYYNPDTDTWTDSPTIPTLSQGRVYMEGAVASDGYFYVIGGRDSAGAIVYDANERLMVGAPVGPCTPSDLPWLSVNPISGTLSAGGSEQITVSLDASGLATGSYAGSLCFTTNDPASPLIRVPVNFEVVERANLQVAHLAPFATGAGTAVTITLNSTVVLTNVVYGDSMPYLSVPAGTTLVEVWPAGSMSPAISATVDLMPGMDYTAIAIGDGVNQPLELLPLVDDNTAPMTGSFKLRIGHLAPFASGPATADVRLQDGTPILTDVVFSAVAPYLELPAGSYDLKITTPGGGTTLIDPAPAVFNAGDIVSVF
ncbi:MAG: DUF4397 domain-containing protein, partial [Anaerolineales bacterium]|nr:DUF4397 domain-containing protein [Anaerolineales bacterium]